jgi:hypothetical protein
MRMAASAVIRPSAIATPAQNAGRAGLCMFCACMALSTQGETF